MMTNDARVKTTLRIKQPIDDRLERACADIGISKNAYITMLLSEKFGKVEKTELSS